MTDLLVVVPARGGSKGVPRKNVRLVAGEPLVSRAVRQAGEVAERAGLDARIVVATNDPQIAQCARLAGAEVIDRSDASETPDAPVMSIVAEVCRRLGWSRRTLIWQPSTVIPDEVLPRVADMARGSVPATLTTGDHGIRWWRGEMVGERVNRQHATTAELEVGVFLVPAWASGGMEWRPFRIDGLADVDTHDDLAAARRAAVLPHRVVFACQCGGEALTGTGHLHRALLLADELSDLDVTFLPTGLDDWGREVVESYGYGFTTTVAGALVCIDGPEADAGLVNTMRYHGARAVAVFEDDGPAAESADLVVNELLAGPGMAGPRYATVRPEFHVARAARVRWPADCPNVLVTFGGSDPTDMTERVERALADVTDRNLVTVSPPMAKGSPWEAPMAELMAGADLVVTSAGRTVYEAMCVGVPVVSIPVNEREASRPASRNIARLPPPWLLSDEQLRIACAHMLGEHGQRMALAGMAEVDGRGAERVGFALRGLVNDLL